MTLWRIDQLSKIHLSKVFMDRLTNWVLLCLFHRGVDPNDIDREGTTPLMIAARLGRDENIKELMSVTIEEDEQMTEDAETEDMNDEPRKEVKRVNINAKNKKTKAAIHYAAKHGHEVSELEVNVLSLQVMIVLLCR